MNAGPAVLAAPVNAPDDPARAVFRRIAWRLLPLLTLAYIVNFLDRTNIGFAAITMNHDIGLSSAQFGYGAGVLFISYCFAELRATSRCTVSARALGSAASW